MSVALRPYAQGAMADAFEPLEGRCPLEQDMSTAAHASETELRLQKRPKEVDANCNWRLGES